MTPTPTATVTPVATILSFYPKRLAFPEQVFGTVGATSRPIGVTLTNPLSNRHLPAVLMGPITVSGDFAIDPAKSTCHAHPILAANSSCMVTLTFTPTALGARAGSLTIGDDAANGPQVVTLSGNGVKGAMRVSQVSIAFDKVAIGTEKEATITLRNPNRAPLIVNDIRTGLADYEADNGCLGLLAPRAECSFKLDFTPASTGLKDTTLFIDDNAAHSPQTVSLSGRGAMPVLAWLPTSINFGRVVIGAAPARSVTLTNRTAAPIQVNAITSDDAAFSPSQTCVGLLEAGQSCTFPVSFAPMTAGAVKGKIGIVDDAFASPQIVTVIGTGITARANR